jgi:glycosyltransferase involved in cell wall biosynthesis
MRGLYWADGPLACVSGDSDVAIMPWNLRLLSLLPALTLARRRSVATVLWGHGYSKRETKSRRALRDSLSRRSDAVVFYSHREAARYLGRNPRPERVFVAPNALDQAPIRRARDQWLATPHALEAFRTRERLAGSVVLFVSRLERDNRVDLLLAAGAELLHRGRELTIVIVGDGPVREELQRFSQELGITDRVRFAGAIYDEAELAPWFITASVFCYPRNIGLSLLHSFGYGVPVVTSDDLGAQNPEIEALRDGHTGLLYKDGDVSSMARQVARILDDRALATYMSLECLRAAHELYSLHRMVDGFVAAIEYVAATSRRAAGGPR